jgi:exodeoxyribonuclease-3
MESSAVAREHTAYDKQPARHGRILRIKFRKIVSSAHNYSTFPGLNSLAIKTNNLLRCYFSMLKIVSANLNGIRSAAKKGFFEWMQLSNADIVCTQEIRIQASDMTPDFLAPPGYHGHFHYAEKKGYAGTGIYSKRQPDAIQTGFGDLEFDAEGRYIQCDFGNLSVISLYSPSGSSSPERQLAKFRFMAAFFPHLEKLKESGREFIICGDWNIAHQAIDLKNWKANQKNSGFLPEERAWLTRIFNEIKLIDVFRQLEPGAEHYTWWSNRGNAWANNVGWRIDYQIATESLASLARTASIFKEQRFSDHAPLIIDYEFDF